MAAPTTPSELDALIREELAKSAPTAATVVARELSARFPMAAVLLYGSGITVSADDPSGTMYDYYVIVRDYSDCFASAVEKLAARFIPPNVYYFEADTELGLLRAKYAVLSASHFEELVSTKTFHSYFWARFAQPMRLLAAPDELRGRIARAVRSAVLTFCRRARPLAEDPEDWRSIWLAGLRASYGAELRAEGSERVQTLLDHIADWAERSTESALAELPPMTAPASGNRCDFRGARLFASKFAWRLRAIQGALLSVARLLKASATFDGGIEYIAWKIHRHSGIDVALRPWERRHPFIAAPIVAVRYFRLRTDSAPRD